MRGKLNGTVIVTYRCNARCGMCSRYKAPSRPEEEITVEALRRLPRMYFTNVTGGEPFVRTDLADVVRELYRRSDRVVISTNGYFTDRVLALCEEFPRVGIRVSIEGMRGTNDAIRGLPDGFDRGLETLRRLVEAGHPDVGFGMTVQDANAADVLPLYRLSDEMGVEFATASLHNSFYFVESRNAVRDRPAVAAALEGLVNELLRSREPKKWFRAYFNHGLINYVYGQPRLLPCDMAFDTFFVDPYGDVMPCNGTRDKEVMGNINRQGWDEIWGGPAAEAVRARVRRCGRNCWMIGSVSPAMRKRIWRPALWVLRHRAALLAGRPYDARELPAVRAYAEGRVTREELDALSTCDPSAEASDGLSDASRAEAHEFRTEEAL
jgi:MoaA/NifB/PqqE/SkfB family radical SAM enzyme